MPPSQNFDLEQRMLTFAQKVRDFCSDLPHNPANGIYGNQLLRSSSSIGANYIEANDALGKKDFLVKIKTARREAKETRYWLNLLIFGVPQHQQVQSMLVDEATQLIKILSAIALKVT